MEINKFIRLPRVGSLVKIYKTSTKSIYGIVTDNSIIEKVEKTNGKNMLQEKVEVKICKEPNDINDIEYYLELNRVIIQ